MKQTLTTNRPIDKQGQQYQYVELSVGNQPSPENPSILNVMGEMAGTLTTAEQLCDQLRYDVLGPEILAKIGDGAEKEPMGLHSMILSVNTRLACLVGELRTINARIGCKE